MTHFTGEHHLEEGHIFGDGLVSELHIVGHQEVSRVALGTLNATQDEQSSGLRHRLDNEHVWHDEFCGEITREEGLVETHVLDPYNMALV